MSDPTCVVECNSKKAVCRERLEQALRVMEGLSEHQRAHEFDMHVYAKRTPHGISACIAGFCGFDPWFQEREFETSVGDVLGSTSVPPGEFFGTEKPFLPSYYRGRADQPADDVPISYEEAVAALKVAIVEFTEPLTDA